MESLPRTSETDVDPLFLKRWSPRDFDGSAMPLGDLMTVLDAGRWAPSAFNYQPWRFLYALRGDDHWAEFLSVLVPFNAGWAANASALVFILSDSLMKSDEGTAVSHSHSFDAGAAWAQIALQSVVLGYHAHAMTGLDFDLAREVLGVPEHFRVEAAIALGTRTAQPLGRVGSREPEAPSGRRPLEETVFAGRYR